MSHFSTIKTQLKEAEPLIKALKNLEDALGQVTVKNKTSDAFISNQNENLNQLNNESNVTF
mgnify:CR=1 FL=1